MRWVRVRYDNRNYGGHWIDDHIVTENGPVLKCEEVTWLAPVQPSKIVGLALNYRDHAAELGLAEPEEPVLFFKPPSALTGHLNPIYYPQGSTHCHYETELAVVIGRRCRGVSAERALDYVRGYTIANDFTCRDYITNMFRPPVRAKGFDTFCPLGPALYPADEVADPGRLQIVTRVNGEIRQSGNTRHLAHGIPDIIAYLSSFMTLEAEDVILSGTPRGISPVYPGDRIMCEIEGLGELVNTVESDSFSG